MEAEGRRWRRDPLLHDHHAEPNDLVAKLHNRMPVILGPEDWPAWLGEEPTGDPAALLKPFPTERMTMWPVSKAVGNLKNQGTELANPVVI